MNGVPSRIAFADGTFLRGIPFISIFFNINVERVLNTRTTASMQKLRKKKKTILINLCGHNFMQASHLPRIHSPGHCLLHVLIFWLIQFHPLHFSILIRSPRFQRASKVPLVRGAFSFSSWRRSFPGEWVCNMHHARSTHTHPLHLLMNVVDTSTVNADIISARWCHWCEILHSCMLLYR